MTKMSSMVSAFIAQTAAPTAAPTGATPSTGGFGGSWIMIAYLLLFAALYFFMIAPQRKKQKEHEKMLATLQSGDEIVTGGGIFGVITNVKEDRFVVRIADNTKIEVGKGFVQTVLKKTGDNKK